MIKYNNITNDNVDNKKDGNVTKPESNICVEVTKLPSLVNKNKHSGSLSQTFAMMENHWCTIQNLIQIIDRWCRSVVIYFIIYRYIDMNILRDLKARLLFSIHWFKARPLETKHVTPGKCKVMKDNTGIKHRSKSLDSTNTVNNKSVDQSLFSWCFIDCQFR
jgi:hypothetical protein